jgi:protoporphyrin/coproporphyrin ferrochelatase
VARRKSRNRAKSEARVVKTAVVLMAYGSPTRLEDVPAYLEDIRGGRPSAPGTLQHLVERYRGIGGSPLNEITERQRAALERELGLPVFVGMKHWAPRISEAVEQALATGAERIVGLVLAPHYSKLSIGGYRSRLEEALAERAELVFVESWFDHEPFLDVVADRLRGTNAHVVFTAHSLPERVLEGDPYEEQIRESGRLIAERARLVSWSVAFQSESQTGGKWLGPDILRELEDLKSGGVERVLVAPVGFVSDHLEILWDLDVEARRRADELGIGFERMPSLNDDPAFISALAALVRQASGAPTRIGAR